jgi:hypothetical protein
MNKLRVQTWVDFIFSEWYKYFTLRVLYYAFFHQRRTKCSGTIEIRVAGTEVAPPI